MNQQDQKLKELQDEYQNIQIVKNWLAEEQKQLYGIGLSIYLASKYKEANQAQREIKKQIEKICDN